MLSTSFAYCSVIGLSNCMASSAESDQLSLLALMLVIILGVFGTIGAYTSCAVLWKHIKTMQIFHKK
jgi:hypothetical protein